MRRRLDVDGRQVEHEVRMTGERVHALAVVQAPHANARVERGARQQHGAVDGLKRGHRGRMAQELP